ncbi:hypothetical protein BG015_009194 [Linnemannia schmuckeri]|uniref:PAP-associated domain-containing protein n=1 Tax=Linnemannia schmuckeri TaxID=64567 RepID=A0A9P5RWD1_9FUNG|nr:hypothetical protein BG015_009194 [Linnemannia schmuckeri]
MPHDLSPDNQVINGNNTSFFSDLAKLEGFGSANKESLGGLFYAFFRKFAIEFDYDHHVASVRHGCYLTKESKGWHLPGKHYRLLCVEEPFDTSRNLGNSCDMASSKGLKHEFKRALDILNHNGSLDQVCEQWIFPSSYYHSTNNGYRNLNGNGQFSGNNTASLGRRYAAGYRSRPHTRDAFDRNNNNNSNNNGGGGASDRSNGSSENFKSNRNSNSSSSSSNFNNNNGNAEGRQDRNNYERRPRSSSASVATSSSLHTPRLVETSLEGVKEHGAQTENILEGEPASESAKNGLTGQSDAMVHHHTGSSRPRRSSVHSSDSTSGSVSHSSVMKQGDKAKVPGSPTSANNSQRRSKPSAAKGSGTEGTKGNNSSSSSSNHGGSGGNNSSHGRQKNGRSGNGSHRESGGHGSKAPRATVELCLADIAKTTPHLFAGSKSETALSESSDAASSVSIGTAGDALESSDAAKKKKAGKKSLLWSTNSNRGESGSNHHHHHQHHGHRSSKIQDQHSHHHSHHQHQQTSHATKTKTARVDEAGPLIDSIGDTPLRSS